MLLVFLDGVFVVRTPTNRSIHRTRARMCCDREIRKSEVKTTKTCSFFVRGAFGKKSEEIPREWRVQSPSNLSAGLGE